MRDVAFLLSSLGFAFTNLILYSSSFSRPDREPAYEQLTPQTHFICSKIDDSFKIQLETPSLPASIMRMEEVINSSTSVNAPASLVENIGNSVILINGLPGVGKYTVAKELQKR